MATVYFGNLRKQVSLPAPKSGMDASGVGRSEKEKLANGGAFISQSGATHRQFDMAWGASLQSDLQPLFDLRNGLHGSGLLYLCDPFADNAMPPHWAEPGLTEQGWPSLVSASVQPTFVPEGVQRTNKILDPNVVGSGNWTALGGATIDMLTTAGAVRGASVGRATATAAATAYGVSASYTFPVTAGEAYAFSGYLRGNVTRNVSLRLTWTGATATTGTAFANTPGFTRRSMTGTVPAGATAVRVDIIASATSVAIGDYVEWDGMLYERGISTVGDYFDGSTPFVDGREAYWAGAVDYSESITVTPVAGMPKLSAKYSLSTPLGSAFPARSATFIIPADKTLNVGFSGSSTGAAGVFGMYVTTAGVLTDPFPVTLLSTGAAARTNMSISGSTYSAVIFYLDTTQIGTATVTLNSAHASYATGAATVNGVYVPGTGHTGMRFDGDVTKSYIMQRNGKSLLTAAATLTEIGAWL